MTDDGKPEPGSAEVAKRMAVLRRHLHHAVPLSEAATDAGISARTARRWLARYRADGPEGLARPIRPEAGKRTFPKELVELIEGMALLKARPWLTTVLDDHSRVIAGYMVFLGAPSALNTSLALPQAICRPTISATALSACLATSRSTVPSPPATTN